MKKRVLAIALAALLLLGCAACGGSDTPPDQTDGHTERPTVPSSMLITELEMPEGTVSDAVSPSNTYYVSPDGSDLNPGTEDAPFRSLYYVKDVLTRYKDAVSGDITVVLGGGYYRLFKPLDMTQEQLRKADGGAIVFRAAEGEEPILSGGLQVSGWVKTAVNGIDGIYKTRIAGLPYVREFYAGNLAQTRATYGKSVEWAWNTDRSGIKLYDIDLSAIANMEDVELVWPVSWKIFILQAQSYEGREMYLETDTWNDFVDMIDLMVSRGESEEYYPTTRYPVYLNGDISFLDEPGEWYYNEATGELYYYPAEGVDMKTTEFFVPVVENMISLTGSEDSKLQNVTFQGITFRHGAWNESARQGLIINQAQNKMTIKRSSITGNVKVEYEQYDACITVRNADSIHFKECIFENMASTALSLYSGIQNSSVEGCIFRQSADGGLVLSNNNASETTPLTICKNNLISNNLFRQTGLYYWSAPALTMYYADSTTVSHNDIYDVPYSGMSIGWGWYWTPNSTTTRNTVVEYNRIGKFLQRCRDGGGIYTLGQQPDSTVRYNYIFDQYNAYGGLYHDEGSAHFVTEYNVVDNIYNYDPNVNWIHVNGGTGGPNGGKTTYDLQIHYNYYSNEKTSFWGEPSTCDLSDNYYVENGEWPEEAKQIMETSGLEAGYQYLLEK